MIYWQYTLFNLLSRCSQSIPLVLVFFSFFRLRKKILRQNFFFLFSIILIGVTDRIFFVHTHGFILYFFSFLFLLLIYTGLFFCGQFSFKAVICLILLVYKSLLVPIGDMVAIRFFPDVIQPLSGLPHIVSQVIVAILLFPIAWFLIRYKILPPVQKNSAWMHLVTLLMGIITLNLLFLVITIPESVANTAYNLSMIFFVSICYYFIYSLIQNVSREIEYSIEIEQLKFERNYEKELNESYHNLKKLRHDFKNHILCIQAMLRQQEYNELDSYCKELTENVYASSQYIDTGNPIANAILNQKCFQAFCENIPIEIYAVFPEALKMQKMDLCAVISNLFDNALEASRHISEPQIKIEIKPVKNYIYFLFANKYNASYSDTNHFHTTKKDKAMHGFGLEIVKDIVNKYNGILDISSDDDLFKVKIMFIQE
ncbi:MAG: GHKL domain-containing protein [Lachnospiraceae bacterium]